MISGPKNERSEELEKMVEKQIIERGIKDPDLIKSMLAVPRRVFVPDNLMDLAYEDRPLPIGEGQTISQPFIVASMIEALQLKPEDKVLEIGTGSGYAAAVLSRIVARVFTVERIGHLAEEAVKVLKKLGYDNIEVMLGDGTLGWPEKAPFEGILVSAGAPAVPDSLCQQLTSNGRLVIPVGDREVQELLCITKGSDGRLFTEALSLARFVPLIGEKGWQ